MTERGFAEWPGHEGEVLTVTEWLALVEVKFEENGNLRVLRWRQSERRKQAERIRMAIVKPYHEAGFVMVTA